MAIVWHSIDNLHCYHTETRPADNSYIITKIKYKLEDGRYREEIGMYKYNEENNELFDIKNDTPIFVDFSIVESWIYLNELSDLM